jgi:cation transport ATPase
VPIKNDKLRLVLTSAVIAACILIGLVLVEFAPTGQRSALPQPKWVRFILVSTFMFWYIFASYRSLHRSIRFWAAYAMTLVFHVLVVGHFFSIYVGGTSTMTLVLSCIGELVFMMIIMHWALGASANRVDLTIGRSNRHNPNNDVG